MKYFRMQESIIQLNEYPTPCFTSIKQTVCDAGCEVPTCGSTEQSHTHKNTQIYIYRSLILLSRRSWMCDRRCAMRGVRTPPVGARVMSR